MMKKNDENTEETFGPSSFGSNFNYKLRRNSNFLNHYDALKTYSSITMDKSCLCNSQNHFNKNLYLIINRSLIWRNISMGLSFLALILLSTKLYDVNRDIKFFKLVLSQWLLEGDEDHTSLNNITLSPSAIKNMDILKKDIDQIIAELWSSRTTLILSVLFVIVYILSWTWMAYTIREHKLTNCQNELPMKTLLLLTIFAAIDIAASTGFVMLRIIMYIIRNHYFPMDMRIPEKDDHDQLIGLAALRLSILQSSSGTTDVFVSVIISFLTLLRVYSVICALSFYNKARQSLSNKHIYKHVLSDSGTSIINRTSEINDYFHKPAHYINDKESPRRERFERRFSFSGSTGTEEESKKELKIQAADMPLHMKRAAVKSALEALKLYSTEKHIAESIKQDFDRNFEPTWHCIVGRNWGSCVTHSKQCYIRLVGKDLTILLYKST